MNGWEKIQLLEQQGALDGKLNAHTHTITNLERRTEFGALGGPLEQQTKTTEGLQLMMSSWGVPARGCQNEAEYGSMITYKG